MGFVLTALWFGGAIGTASALMIPVIVSAIYGWAAGRGTKNKWLNRFLFCPSSSVGIDDIMLSALIGVLVSLIAWPLVVAFVLARLVWYLVFDYVLDAEKIKAKTANQLKKLFGEDD